MRRGARPHHDPDRPARQRVLPWRSRSVGSSRADYGEADDAALGAGAAVADAGSQHAPGRPVRTLPCCSSRGSSSASRRGPSSADPHRGLHMAPAGGAVCPRADLASRLGREDRGRAG
ncbi:hypothetical protein HBB16_08400 [Pseudonocardia sp. MCCB 268]|nr:hypothetical protein [Pseudonocardia cytotoxica]